MVKIFKLNKTGTTGVVINKQMKAAGYEQGKEVVWEAMTGGFLLKIVKPTTEYIKEASSPLPEPEKSVEATNKQA